MARSVCAVLLIAALAGCGKSSGSGGPSPCPAGLARCGDACVALQTSADHCGACATACSATQTCVAGSCGCAGGTSACGGECVNLQSSAAHCGGCANACPAGAACTRGACAAVCAAPEVACGLACADLSTSGSSCGRCERACASGARCDSGACTTAACTGLLDVPGAPLLPVGGQIGGELAAGDLDEDGALDLVAASNATVGVALASAGARFERGTSVALPAGAWAAGVLVARLDGDAHLDLAVVDRTGFVHVAMGRGDGTFGAVASHEVGSGSGADGIVAADLDGDGDLDLAVSLQGGSAWGDLGGVAVLLNDGDGTFASATFLTAGVRTSAIAAGDLNGDGLVDLVVANRSGHVGTGNVADGSVFLGTGGGAFGSETAITTGGSPQAVALADLNGDGLLDLVGTSADGGTSVLLGAGDGSFEAPVSYAPGADGLAIVDLDGDGHLDVALATGDLLLGLGSGALSAGTVGTATMLPFGIVAEDLDGDGRVDLAYGSGLVALGRADGSFAVPVTVSPGAPLDVGDVNGDLDPDLVVSVRTPAGDDELTALLGRGDGTFVAATPVARTSGRWLARLADVDGDGRLDLVTFDGTALAVWFGGGDGSFAAGPSFNPGTPVVELLALDLDHDGRADLVTRDALASPDSDLGSAVRVRHGRGDGTFDPPGLVTGDATALAAADLDGDGAPDLVLGSRRGVWVDVFLNGGDGTFAAPLGVRVEGVVTGLAVGELDGDGVADVVMASSSSAFPESSFLATLRGLGGGALGAPVAFARGSIPTAPVLGDLDGDGRAELLYESESAWVLVLSRNAGDGTFVAPQRVALAESPVAIADLDRDGRPDVVARDVGGGVGYGTLVLRTRCRR